jgi:hypothetical protein
VFDLPVIYNSKLTTVKGKHYHDFERYEDVFDIPLCMQQINDHDPRLHSNGMIPSVRFTTELYLTFTVAVQDS